MEKISNIYKRKDHRGIFVEYANGNTGWKSVNGGFMHKGKILGNHYHKKCQALFFIIKGSAVVRAKDVRNKKSNIQKIVLRQSQGCTFEPYETHSITFLENSNFLLLKSKKFSEKNKDIFELKIA